MVTNPQVIEILALWLRVNERSLGFDSRRNFAIVRQRVGFELESQVVVGSRLPFRAGDALEKAGSTCWARTSDPLINSQLLYQLS